MEKMSERLSWIRELVRTEDQMEESGMITMSQGIDTDRLLANESLKFLQEMKNEFIDAATAFNELKSSALGRIKIYGIAKTHSDFMLFRNGFKMIFSVKHPGVISIRFNFIGPQYIPSPIPTTPTSQGVGATHANMMEEVTIDAKWGPFSELQWTFQGQPIRLEAAVRHHFTLFVRESTR